MDRRSFFEALSSGIADNRQAMRAKDDEEQRMDLHWRNGYARRQELPQKPSILFSAGRATETLRRR
jgi:hypothetical protein